MRVLGLIKIFLMSRARMGRMVCKQARALRVLKPDLSLLRSAFPSPCESADYPAPQGWVWWIKPRTPGVSWLAQLWRKDRAGTQAMLVAGSPIITVDFGPSVALMPSLSKHPRCTLSLRRKLPRSLLFQRAVWCSVKSMDPGAKNAPIQT